MKEYLEIIKLAGLIIRFLLSYGPAMGRGIKVLKDFFKRKCKKWKRVREGKKNLI